MNKSFYILIFNKMQKASTVRIALKKKYSINYDLRFITYITY